MAGYRETCIGTSMSSDDSSSDSDSDSDEDQPWKRRKTTSQPQGIRSDRWLPTGSDWEKCGTPASQPAERPHIVPSLGSQAGAKRARKNNVWGQVVQEQNEALVAREMDEFGMELSRSRDVESYNYKLGVEEDSSRVRLGVPSISKPKSARERKLKRGFGETEDDGWLVNRQGKKPDDIGGTRRPVHERLGEREVSHRPIAKARLGSRSDTVDLTPMKFITIDASLSKEEITGKLAYSLQEAKRDLIVRVVNTLGVKKSLELWKLTADIERDGGMMILNGSRRRSPGGVFLQLMKTDPQVTKHQINEIYAEERKKENEQKHKRDRHRRRKKTVQFKDVKTEDVVVGGDDETAERAEGTDGGKKSNRDGRGPSVPGIKEEEVVARASQATEMEEGEIEDDGGGRSMEEGEIEDDDDEAQGDKTLVKEELMK